MKVEAFERIVLRLANQTPTRWWRHWNHPHEPALMAVEFEPGPSERIVGELERLGLRWHANVKHPDGLAVFVIERTDGER